MEKKYQILYIWSFIIVSTFILLLLYTPLGGDLHESIRYEEGYNNTGVNFGGSIANSPKIKTSQGGFSSESGVIASSSLPKYSNSGASSSTFGTSSSTKNFAGSTYSSNKSTTNKVSAGGGGGGGSSTGISGGGGSSQAGSGGAISAASSFTTPNRTATTGGIAKPFTATIDNTSGTTVYKDPLGDSDVSGPGGDEGLGATLPIGDGVYLLLFFALMYAAKISLFKK